MAVVYVKDSSGVRKVELPDTRKAFCQEVNRLSAQTGIVASVSPFPALRAARVLKRVGRKSGQRIKSRAR